MHEKRKNILEYVEISSKGKPDHLNIGIVSKSKEIKWTKVLQSQTSYREFRFRGFPDFDIFRRRGCPDIFIEITGYSFDLILNSMYVCTY